MKRDRAWRRHQDNRVVQNRLEQVRNIDPKHAEALAEKAHKLAKDKPLGCGRSECPLCHPNKNYQDGNHKDYEYYKRHPEEVDPYLLDPDYEDVDSGE